MQGLKSDWTIGAVNRYSHITTNSRNQKITGSRRRRPGAGESHSSESLCGDFRGACRWNKNPSPDGLVLWVDLSESTDQGGDHRSYGFLTSSGGLNTR